MADPYIVQALACPKCGAAIKHTGNCESCGQYLVVHNEDGILTFTNEEVTPKVTTRTKKKKQLVDVIYYTGVVSTEEGPVFAGSKDVWVHKSPEDMVSADWMQEQFEEHDLADTVRLVGLSELSRKHVNAKVVLVDQDCMMRGEALSSIVQHCSRYHRYAQIFVLTASQSRYGTVLWGLFYNLSGGMLRQLELQEGSNTFTKDRVGELCALVRSCVEY